MPVDTRTSKFDPKEDDVRDCIIDVERVKETYGWDEDETMHRVSPYLIGVVGVV
jgi:hypothetical protein